MESGVRAHRTCFGAFEVDLRAGELYKHGIRLKLQDQPFQILALLLDCPGDVVTREELCQKLWPTDTFVDFDTGLNSAIKKLRDVLADSAEEPTTSKLCPGVATASLPKSKTESGLRHSKPGCKAATYLWKRKRTGLARNVRGMEESTPDQPGLRGRVSGLF